MDSCCLEAVLFWKLVGILRVGPDRGRQLWELLWRVPCPWSPPLSVSWWPESKQCCSPTSSCHHDALCSTTDLQMWAEISETVSQSKPPLRLLSLTILPHSLPQVTCRNLGSTSMTLFYLNRCIPGWPGILYVAQVGLVFIMVHQPLPLECWD